MIIFQSEKGKKKKEKQQITSGDNNSHRGLYTSMLRYLANPTSGSFDVSLLVLSSKAVNCYPLTYLEHICNPILKLPARIRVEKRKR